MKISKATTPVRAEQYTGPESVDAVAELVREYRLHASYDHGPGVLRFYDSGPSDLRLETTDWVVVMGSNVVVMKASLFENWVDPDMRLKRSPGSPRP